MPSGTERCWLRGDGLIAYPNHGPSAINVFTLLLILDDDLRPRQSPTEKDFSDIKSFILTLLSQRRESTLMAHD